MWRGPKTCLGPHGQEGARTRMADLPRLELPAYSDPLVRLSVEGRGLCGGFWEWD